MSARTTLGRRSALGVKLNLDTFPLGFSTTSARLASFGFASGFCSALKQFRMVPLALALGQPARQPINQQAHQSGRQLGSLSARFGAQCPNEGRITTDCRSVGWRLGSGLARPSCYTATGLQWLQGCRGCKATELQGRRVAEATGLQDCMALDSDDARTTLGRRSAACLPACLPACAAAA